MPAFITIAAKDLRMLWRDPMALFWALGFPIVFALFFGSIMKVGDEVERAKVGVLLVGDAHSARVSGVRDALVNVGFDVALASEQSARASVRAGRVPVLIELPAEGELRPIVLGVDPTRAAEASMVKGALQGVLLRALSTTPVALPPIETEAIASLPVGPRTGYEAVFAAMIAWGLLGCAAAFAVALVSERASGTLLRLYAAPIGRASIVLGKALACLVACLGSAGILSVVGIGMLGVEPSGLGLYTAAVLACALCFVGITQLLGVLGKTEQAVAGAGWSVLIVLAMCGGAMVPTSLMPSWLVELSALSPVQWSIAVLEGATFRAQSFAELAQPLVRLCAVGVVGFASAALVLRSVEA